MAIEAEARSQQVGGTLQYMAPEQFRGDWRDYGPWTDLYSFGCLAWELACGAPPFEGSTLGALRLAHTSRTPPAFRPRHPVPEGLAGWLARLLLKHPADRYQRAADAAFALAGFEGSWLTLTGLRGLAPHAAHALAGFGGLGLSLHGQIDPADVQPLMEFRGRLFVNGRRTPHVPLIDALGVC